MCIEDYLLHTNPSKVDWLNASMAHPSIACCSAIKKNGSLSTCSYIVREPRYMVK